MVSEILMCSLAVAVLAVVQSVFGIGLLLLGTPVLLILGVRFEQALWVLLPASMTISSLQLLLDRGIQVAAMRRFIVWSAPPMLIGLAVVLKTGLSLKIDLVVAALLIFGAILRLSTALRAVALQWLQTHDIGALAGIGLVHGLTNMGGGLLSLYASIRHAEKYDIRQHIALGYVIFALTQLTLLGIAAPSLHAATLAPMYMGIAAAVFVTLGRGAFRRMPGSHYNVLISLFEIGCGSVLIAKRFL